VFLALVAVLAAGSACTKKAAEAPNEGDGGEATAEQQSRAPACDSDLDCVTCATERGCGCQWAEADGACPDTIDSCFADPCGMMVASCWEGRCVMRQGGPEKVRALDRSAGP
jgi:hypothetical protein